MFESVGMVPRPGIALVVRGPTPKLGAPLRAQALSDVIPDSSLGFVLLYGELRVVAAAVKECVTCASLCRSSRNLAVPSKLHVGQPDAPHELVLLGCALRLAR